MNLLFGQHGIRFREALADGHGALAVRLLPELDEAHRIELVLGEALRDGRDGFGAARRFADVDGRGPVVEAIVLDLARPGADRAPDELAAAYVAARRVPDRWLGAGRAVTRAEAAELRAEGQLDVAVARLLGQGAGGLALLQCLADRPLFSAVNMYYRWGTIHALGPRPLLVLAATLRTGIAL